MSGRAQWVLLFVKANASSKLTINEQLKKTDIGTQKNDVALLGKRLGLAFAKRFHAYICGLSGFPKG